jgi:mannose-1-phosphate guanylyltransferase
MGKVIASLMNSMITMTDAVILCGGAGLRLRPVTGDDPKSMAQISGRPFLAMLLSQLQFFGFERVTLAVGIRADAIESYFGETFGGMKVEYSNESSPLGTGGALRQAATHLKSRYCLALNGDSYTAVDLGKLMEAHADSGAEVSMVAVPVDDRGDAGSVVLDGNGDVVQFAEKERSLFAQHLNAGIYMFSRELLERIPAGHPVSLERELFPEWIQQGCRVNGFVYGGKCVDIGTPERYRAAQEVLAEVDLAAASNRNEECTA